MSYIALYRKYRPNEFKEVVGQEHITSTLVNIIKSDKVGHAYLFSGPRGTGKTTVAHVFAKKINTDSMGVEQFSDMDIIEIDAASNNGVAEIRNIIDGAGYAPTKARFKVYIIDEVHMLTKGAFNALLKTLEEPPKHVVFILATTEPHKIPVTILSRTQRFNFRRIPEDVISSNLSNILSKENISIDDDSVRFISKLANGGMRDALSIADQSAAFGNGKVSFEVISQVFGIIGVSNQIKIFNLASKGMTRELINHITNILDNGADVERVSTSMLDILKDFIILKKTGDEKLMRFINKNEAEELQIDVQYAYELVEIIVKLVSDLRFSVVPRQSFELAILKFVRDDSRQPSINSEPISRPEIREEIKVEEKTPSFVEVNKTDESKIQESIQEIEKKHEESLVESLLSDGSQKTQEINIFDTGEINASIDQTVELVRSEQEMMNDTESIQEDILSTQEILIKGISSEENTSELDLMKLFESGQIPMVEEKKDKSKSIDTIINLLVQANRNKIEIAKSNIENISAYSAESKYKNFVNLISKTKIISAGNKFVLISSSDKDVIEGIDALGDDIQFIKFINLLFKEPTNIFAITKDEFDIVKTTWQNLAATNSLPKPMPIKEPKVIKEEKTKEEEYGEDLFGDLFS